jgi:DNA replication protein DnaC
MKSELLLKHYLKKLKLPTILREYKSIADNCAKDNIGYSEFLLRLFERESLDREKRAAERRIKNAKFPVIKTLDTFDFGLQTSINQKLIRELMTGEYIDKKENILFAGSSGTGKSHLASALGFAGCSQGRNVRFFTVRELVTHLIEITEQRQLEKTLKQIERLDVIILDELGYVPFTKTGSELLFDIISRAYERQSLIITTNLAFECWVEIFGCERLTGALLDRLTHRIHIIEANGPSYRLRESTKRLKGKKDTGQDRDDDPGNQAEDERRIAPE